MVWRIVSIAGKGVGADSRGGDAHLCALGTASVDRCCGPDEIYVNALEFQRLVLMRLEG